MTMQHIKRVVLVVALVVGLAAALVGAIAKIASADHMSDNEIRVEAFGDPIWQFVDAGSFGGTPEWSFAFDAGSLDAMERTGVGGGGVRVQ